MPIAASAPAVVPSVSAPPARSRLSSIDVMRGLAMVLMAIDHVRVYSGVPAGGPAPGIFFTRWVTHFCAPAFVFLAGTSAFLHGRKLADFHGSAEGLRYETHTALARYLVTRGAVLVLLELTLIRLAWTFNVDFAHYILAGVIWMLGWCMILLAALMYLPLPAITAIGLAIVVGHNLIDPFLPQLIPAAQASATPWLWQVLYFGPIAGGSGPFVVLYSIVPWIGVMAIGYAFGAVMVMEPERRRRTCVILGLCAIAAFITLRATRVYGDPREWNGVLGLGFLNTTKYPASLQFLLMTLGPMIALLPLVERARGRAAGMFVVFGRVPLFYYDSRRGARRFARARGTNQSVALRESSDGESAAAGGLHMEPRPPLPGLLRCRRGAVRAVPLVRPRESSTTGRVAPLLVAQAFRPAHTSWQP